MKNVPAKEAFISTIARTVGHVAGTIAKGTQDLTAKARAAVERPASGTGEEPGASSKKKAAAGGRPQSSPASAKKAALKSSARPRSKNPKKKIAVSTSPKNPARQKTRSR
ncbi:MAG TPA: hypothetical protein VI386_28945 [Candidatus Sulfotelmatobacter sp.]